MKPLISQGFQVSVSILVTQHGCGRRTRTSDLRVMSYGLDVVLVPLRAFAPFLLEVGVLFGPACSIGSVQSEPRMGHGLGQEQK